MPSSLWSTFLSKMSIHKNTFSSPFQPVWKNRSTNVCVRCICWHSAPFCLAVPFSWSWKSKDCVSQMLLLPAPQGRPVDARPWQEAGKHEVARSLSLCPWPWGQHLCQWWRALEQSCSGHRARKATAVCTALAQEAASWALNKHPPHFTPSLILWLQFCHHVWNQFTAIHPILL